MSWQEATDKAAQTGFELAYVITEDSPIVCVDIDKCIDPVTRQYDERAMRWFGIFGDRAYCEMSRSGLGLHFWGMAEQGLGKVFYNRIKDEYEFYEKDRYIILGQAIQGQMTDITPDLKANLKPRPVATALPETGAVPEYTGPTDDNELLSMAINSRGSAAATFGDAPRFVDLWNGTGLDKWYPSQTDGKEIDYSRADSALLSQLAFWTGRDTARMERLWLLSPMAQNRPPLSMKKLERTDYRTKSVTGAAALANAVYTKPRAVLPGTETDLLRSFPASSFHGKPVPERSWLVQNWIPGDNVTLFSGSGGGGKSTIALQLAVSTATGSPWLGRPVRRGKVLVLSAEDPADEQHRRLSPIAQQYGLSLDQLSDLHLVDRAGEDAVLASQCGNTGLRETSLFSNLVSLVESIKPVLVVIDTLADTFGGNENDRVQARRYVSMLRDVAMRNNAAVVILSHPSLSGISSGSGLSGSTAWDGSVRSRLYLERIAQNEYEPDPDIRRLSNKKLNYGRSGSEITVRYVNGVFVPNQTHSADHEVAAKQKFLELLNWHIEHGIEVGPNNGPNFAPKKFAEHSESQSFTKAVFRDAMNSLLSSGQIIVAEVGPPSRRKSILALPEPQGQA
ncbi:AAA family ATPase [Ruegeria sp. HKCCD7303]|uniref:AAA family ATPase n=1 Tax=Ruegeria sp. HKCCD7303 TaxID=2683013 RepID=UPI001492FCFD|nr:AAA family ATPase [Ruegeria sp. HKCCD7303]NOD67603.1 AAA family ATPase [Ruegeria sp. HKCCD7303]